MPSLSMQKRINAQYGKTIGQAHKYESDLIMEDSWYRDINSRTCYLYDQDHDEEFDKKDDLHPEKTRKIPVDLKVFEIEYNSLAKDEVAYHIMFKPSYQCDVSYYEEKFAKPLGAHFPIGLYCDIPDSDGIYHRWLIVDQYREYSNQFPTYLVLPTNHKMQWVFNKKKYESWAVLRSQNSYNSGEWEADKFRSVENQKMVWYSFNDKTVTMFYNQRVAISQLRDIPIVWRCSKVEDKNVNGIIKCTYTQNKWDEHKDYIETDDEGNLIGIWCDWFTDENPIGPTPIDDEKPEAIPYSIITCSGVKAELKVKGGYKKFTCDFYRDNMEINFDSDGVWTYIMDGQDATPLLNIMTPATTPGMPDNQVKVKFMGGDDYLSSVLTISYTTTSGITSSIDVAITSL